MTIQKNEEEKAYSFFKYIDTEEIHIFKGNFTPSGCRTSASSICKKIENRNHEDVTQLRTCLNEDQARRFSVTRGRAVCGICVGSLYATYKK